jgi:hypothetical protein
MRHYRIGMFGKGSVIARITLRHLAMARETRLGGEREFTATQLHTDKELGCLIGKRHFYDATR